VTGVQPVVVGVTDAFETVEVCFEVPAGTAHDDAALRDRKVATEQFLRSVVAAPAVSAVSAGGRERDVIRRVTGRVDRADARRSERLSIVKRRVRVDPRRLAEPVDVCRVRVHGRGGSLGVGGDAADVVGMGVGDRDGVDRVRAEPLDRGVERVGLRGRVDEKPVDEVRVRRSRRRTGLDRDLDSGYSGRRPG